jgi:ribosomal protein L21E
MLKRRPIREKGKRPLSHIFKTLNIGDYVTLKAELGGTIPFLKRMQGKSGRVTAKRGESYIVIIKDGNRPKQYIVPSIHLKKLKISQ